MLRKPLGGSDGELSALLLMPDQLWYSNRHGVFPQLRHTPTETVLPLLHRACCGNRISAVGTWQGFFVSFINAVAP